MNLHVFRAPDGCGETYIGPASSMEEAEALVARHEAGEVPGLPDYLYDTAKAAGHCDGISAPPETGGPIAWIGKDGWYCVNEESHE